MNTPTSGDEYVAETVLRLNNLGLHSASELVESQAATIATLQRDAAQLAGAILWALGYEMGKPAFEPPLSGTPRYWWRKELERRAGGHANLAARVIADEEPKA